MWLIRIVNVGQTWSGTWRYDPAPSICQEVAYIWMSYLGNNLYIYRTKKTPALWHWSFRYFGGFCNLGAMLPEALAESMASEKPVFMDVRPWGSMSSIVTHSFIRGNRILAWRFRGILTLNFCFRYWQNCWRVSEEWFQSQLRAFC